MFVCVSSHLRTGIFSNLFIKLPHEDREIQEKIKHAYSVFPWQCGYSAVNFYSKLKYTTPKKNRPQILSMQYSSPGWIELMLIVSVAVALKEIVKSVSTSIRDVNCVYSEIHKGLSERKLLRIEIKKKEIELEKQYAEYIQRASYQMSELLGLDDIKQIHQKSGSPLKTLKILLSLYRRVKILVEFQNRGKTKL